MKNNNKFNININKDDHNLNDYLHSWTELGDRPNKTTLHGYFDTEKFLKILENKNYVNVNSFCDIAPSDEVSIVNQKNFIVIDGKFFLTFTHFDKNHEESLIGEVSFFFTNNSEPSVEKIIEEILECVVFSENNEEDEVIKNNFFVLNLSQNGFELESLDIKKDFDDIEFYYESDVLKKVKKVIKSVKKEKKGLTIISGDRGCGKTSLINYITTKIDKKFIFIPCNLIENTINNPDFRRFLRQNVNSVLILDDVELYFSQMYSKSTFFTSNLLQLVDGLVSDTLNLNIILGLNCSLSEIDKTLIYSNNLIDNIEIGKLSINKIDDLLEHLGKKSKIKNQLKLIEVLKDQTSKSENNELGFK